jgi:excisionase family DNA binding protein
MEQDHLVTISEASNLLGVSETALRQWTGEGKIEAFITPGGHRRYSKEDLKKLIGLHQKALGIKDLVSKLEDTAGLHHDIARSFMNTTWYRQLDHESQENLASLGRRLLDLIIEYVSEPGKREETSQSVREVGQGFGNTLAKLGFPLTDSVEAFILHRTPVLNAATDLMKKRGIFAGRIVGTIPQVGKVMDQALVALVEAHQKYAITTHS